MNSKSNMFMSYMVYIKLRCVTRNSNLFLLSQCFKTKDHLPTPDLIIKLNVFFTLFVGLISPIGHKIVPVPCKSNGKEQGILV